MSLIPVLGATARLVQLSGGPELIPADSRFAASPVPLLLHVMASIGFALLGALQFSAGLRRRHPGWHRRTGRLLVILGLLVAQSGLAMTLLYPHKPGTGEILYVVRLLVASGMTASVLLGFAAIRRRDVGAHRAWMMRAYALALGAGTQAFTVGFGEAAFGAGVVRTDLLLSAGWLSNLGVAEWLIRRRVSVRGMPQRRAWTVTVPTPANGNRG
jgi:uncharacterized membrane protein